MPQGQIEIVGGRQFRKTLRGAGDDLSDLKAAHTEAGQIARDSAFSLAPADEGFLRNTIRSSGTKTAAILRAGNNSKVRYAGPIHWGWWRKHIKKNPFLTRGAADSESRWIKVYEAAVNRALDKIKGI